MVKNESCLSIGPNDLQMFRPLKSVKQFIMPLDDEVRFGYFTFSVFRLCWIFSVKSL